MAARFTPGPGKQRAKQIQNTKDNDTDYKIQILTYKQVQTFQSGRLKPGLGNQRSKGIPNVKYNIYTKLHIC